MRKIVFATLRNNNGATGGPGGVLYLNKIYIGEQLNERIRCLYWFNQFDKNTKLYKYLNKLYFLIKVFFSFDTYYIVHDIESAYLISFLRKRYSIIYHNQGPIVREYKNFNVQLSEKEIKKYQHIEYRAFKNAYSVHFPSIGAKQMYFNDAFASCRLYEINLGETMYNTIPLHQKARNDIDIDPSYNGITFFSLGTITAAKGQDRCIVLLGELLELTNTNIRYIIVGNGPLQQTVIKGCQLLKKKYTNFEYYYYSHLDHSTVMYIHSIADVYIMLHRISIFDFATLEAMCEKNVIVLSRVGGNLDFNKDNNVIFIDDPEKDAKNLINIDYKELKQRNYDVFNKYFSSNAFQKRYTNLVFNIANI